MINVSEVLAILISAITQAEDRRRPASLRSSHRLLNDRVATVGDEQVRPEVLKDVVEQKENLLRFEPIGGRSRFRLRHQHRDRNAIEHEINGRSSDDDVGRLLHRSHEGLRGRMALQRHIEFREVIVDAVRRSGVEPCRAEHPALVAAFRQPLHQDAHALGRTARRVGVSVVNRQEDAHADRSGGPLERDDPKAAAVLVAGRVRRNLAEALGEQGVELLDAWNEVANRRVPVGVDGIDHRSGHRCSAANRWRRRRSPATRSTRRLCAHRPRCCRGRRPRGAT